MKDVIREIARDAEQRVRREINHETFTLSEVMSVLMCPVIVNLGSVEKYLIVLVKVVASTRPRYQLAIHPVLVTF